MGEYYGVRRTNDPDGEYLQHWGILKGAMREGHKYLARLVTPSGYRYIYNQAELAAAKAGKAVSGAAKSASNAANSAYRAVRKGIGIDARERAQKASARAERMTAANNSRREQSVSANARARNARTHAKAMKSAYDNTLLGRAEKAFNSGRKAVTNAANEAGRQANNLYKSARNTANDAQRYVNKQVKKGQKAISDYQRFRNLPDRMKEEAAAADRAGKKKMFVGVEAYGHKIGKNVSVRGADMANRIWGVERAIRNAPKNAAKAISDTANDVSKAANKTYKKARKQAIQTGKDISKAANDTYKSVSREAARTGKKLSKAANDTYQSLSKEASRTVRKAGRQIDRTVDRAGKNVSKLADNASSAVGLKQRSRVQKTKERALKIQANYDGTKTSNTRARLARANAKRAQESYDRTPLGKAEKVWNDINTPYRFEVEQPKKKKKKKKTQLKRTGNVARAQLTRHTGGNF